MVGGGKVKVDGGGRDGKGGWCEEGGSEERKKWKRKDEMK